MSTGLILVPVIESIVGKDGDRLVILLVAGIKERQLSGDVYTGKVVLRDYINAMIGFEGMSRVFDISSTSLMRMFGPNGNSQASNLFAVIYYLHEQEGIHLDVKVHKVIWGTV